MSFLPISTQLGSLEILEVYIHYNGPRLLSCKNEVNKIFLGLWVDEEDEYDLWLFMLVSINRLQDIRTGKISLRDSFLSAEKSTLYELIYHCDEDEWKFKSLLVESVDLDYLPLEEAFLSCSEETLPQVENQEILSNIVDSDREFLNLSFENNFSQYHHEFPAVKLGKILAAFQPLIDELSIFRNTDPRLKNLDIRRRTEFNARIFSTGSFKVELASTNFEKDIFDNSTAGNAIEELLSLLSIVDNKKQLLDSDLATKKIIVKYKKFLDSLCNARTGLNLKWASPTLSRGGEFQMSFETTSKILESIQDIEILDEKQYVIIGRLFKMDKENWKFGIRQLDTDIAFKGDVLGSAHLDAGTATISEYYEAEILELPKLVSSTNELKKYYQLISLTPYQAPYKQLNLSDIDE